MPHVLGGPRDFPVLLGALVDFVAKEANRRVADVRSAVELIRFAAHAPDCGSDEFHGLPSRRQSHSRPGASRRFCCEHRRHRDRRELASPRRAGERSTPRAGPLARLGTTARPTGRHRAPGRKNIEKNIERTLQSKWLS